MTLHNKDFKLRCFFLRQRIRSATRFAKLDRLLSGRGSEGLKLVVTLKLSEILEDFRQVLHP